MALGVAGQVGNHHVAAAQSAAPATNPLIAAWTGWYGGVPPRKAGEFPAALEAALDEERREMDRWRQIRASIREHGRAYRAFRRRDPDVNALPEKRGFATN